MNFENWWRSKYPTDVGEIEFRLLLEAWGAAKVEEREDCAAICDALDSDPDHLHPCDCAEAIRAKRPSINSALERAANKGAREQ